MRPAAAALTLGMAVSLLATTARAADRLSSREMLSFLVQCIGTGSSGQPALRTGPGAACPKPQSVTDQAAWRKHDWPDTRMPEVEPLGHQASDSVLDPRVPFPLVLQSFDFGDAGRAFGRLDRGNGDGGDAVTVVDGAAYIFFTEDAGAGQQWFVSEACKADASPEAARTSWLIFADDVTTERWAERTARLVQRWNLGECPARFNSAYTRYRRATLAVPFRVARPKAPVARLTTDVDTIISDHFGGRDVASADHLERFYLGRNLGKYRWERWENLANTRNGKAAAQAENLRESGRCPPIRFSEAPGERWVMVDCRTWTNLAALTESWTAESLGWPGDAFAPLRAEASRPPR